MSVSISPNSPDFSDPSPPILALHGFFGAGSDWDFLFDTFAEQFPIGRLISPDLPGHGKLGNLHSGHRLFSINILCSWLATLAATAPTPPILVGYSMGGRIALHLAESYPHHFLAVVLIGASAGLEQALERGQRLREDATRATKIRALGPVQFYAEWEKNPLIASQKNAPAILRKHILDTRFKQSAEGLACALEAFSPGLLPFLKLKPPRYQGPLLLVTGENDPDYSKINRNIARSYSLASHRTIPKCGHAPHFEQPELFLSVLSEFLLSVKDHGSAQ
ncbi:MAG: alpha/beta fold hydrolase [Puniceicoccaceae bacterium]